MSLADHQNRLSWLMDKLTNKSIDLKSTAQHEGKGGLDFCSITPNPRMSVKSTHGPAQSIIDDGTLVEKGVSSTVPLRLASPYAARG